MHIKTRIYATYYMCVCVCLCVTKCQTFMNQMFGIVQHNSKIKSEHICIKLIKYQQ